MRPSPPALPDPEPCLAALAGLRLGKPTTTGLHRGEPRASSAARTSHLPFSSGLAVKSAARSSAIAATITAPRRRAASAWSSRARARSSSKPTVDIARCQRRRSGSTTTSASTSYVASVCAGSAACLTAERISGCRNRNPPSTTSIMPASTAGSSADAVSDSPAKRVAHSRTSSTDARPSSAAARTPSRVSSGSPPSLAANARSRRAVSVGGDAEIRSAAFVAGATRDNSTNANGLPAASASTRARVTGWRSGAFRSRSSPAAAALRRSSSRVGIRASLSGVSYPSRTAANSATGSLSRRREMKVSTLSVERSSQWASSAMRRTGRELAASHTS